MKIMTDYFLSRVRADRRKTLPLLFSILLSSVVISIFACIYVAQHSAAVDFAKSYSGSQHFTINEQLTEEQINILKANDEIAELRTSESHAYITLRDMKKVYPVSEAIAGSIGLERSGYGVYNITYNRQLLGLYGVKDPYSNRLTALGQLILTAAAFIVMVMILFAVIIGGAYAAFGRSRLSELGMLKSVGAAPEQIRYLLYLEAAVCCIPAMLLGPLIGYIVQSLMIKFAFSWWVTLICIALVPLTVFIASSGQIRRLARIPIVAAITGSMDGYAGIGGSGRKGAGKNQAINPANPARSLALQFYRGSRSSYRMSMIALALFFAISISFQTVMAFVKANSFAQLEDDRYNISIHFANGLPDDPLLSEISQAGDLYFAYYMNVCTMTTDMNVDMSAAANAWIYNGQTVLHTILYGLDDITYGKILEQADAAGTDGSVILVNNIGGTNETEAGRSAGGFPFADGKSLTLCARSPYDMENDAEISVPIAAVTGSYPETDSVYFPYNPVIMMNREEYLKVDEALYGDESMSTASVMLHVKYEDIEASVGRISGILDSAESGQEYEITTRLDRERDIRESLRPIERFFNVLIAFFGILGLLNAVNSINTSLEARRRELAILRSIGMDKKEELSMFMWEAAVYGCLPLALSIPIICIAAVLFGFIFKRVTLAAFFGYLSIIGIDLSVIPIVLVIFAVYLWNWRRRGENIIGAITRA